MSFGQKLSARYKTSSVAVLVLQNNVINRGQKLTTQSNPIHILFKKFGPNPIQPNPIHG